MELRLSCTWYIYVYIYIRYCIDFLHPRRMHSVRTILLHKHIPAMMTSWHENTFCITASVSKRIQRWNPSLKNNNAEFWWVFILQWTKRVVARNFRRTDAHVTSLQCCCTSHTYLATPRWLMMSHERHGVPDYRPLECLLNNLFGITSKKHQSSALLALFRGNPSVTGEFHAHRDSNADKIRCHGVNCGLRNKNLPRKINSTSIT